MWMKKRYAIFFLLLLPLFSTYAASLATVEALFKAINTRFDFMQELAANKYSHQYPIDFAVAERITLRQIYFDADKLGFHLRTVRPFVTLQAIISKNIQEAWYLFWRKNGFTAKFPPKDLQVSLIPQLRQYDQDILLALVQAVPDLQTPNNRPTIEIMAEKIIIATFVTPDERKQLVKALVEVRMKSNTTAAVK